MGLDILKADDADPRISMVLADRYKIIRKLGEGGMGTVYEGEHVLIKRRVAIKCLHAHYANSPEIVARFHREALAATSIRHPNIVEVTDMGRFPDGAFFMVLEYLEGRDWAADLSHTGPQPLGRVVHILSQVCDALGAAHEKGIVHRDLKPENVFLCPRGDDPDFAKVLDFGISKMQDSDAESPRSKGLTRTGMAMGTPYYMAPEQAQGKKDIDHRADIYALGVILFQALTNQYPFDDESYPMLVVKICTEDAPPITNFRSDLPPEIATLVARMLAKNPSDRPPSCALVKAALAPFRDHMDTPSGHRSTGMMAERVIGSDRPNPIPRTTPGASPETRPIPDQAPDQPSDQAPSVPSSESVRPSRRTPYAMWGAIVTGLVILSGVSYGVLTRPSEIAIVAPLVNAEAAPVPLQNPDLGVQPSPPSPTPAETSVRVQISTEPEDAVVYLDDHRIPNPFDGDLPQSATPRNLRVEREGFVTNVQDLVLEFPQRVRVRLDRGRGVSDHRAAVHERSTPTRTPSPTPPETRPVTTQPVVTQPAPAPREPPNPPSIPPQSEQVEPPREGEAQSLKNPFRRR